MKDEELKDLTTRMKAEAENRKIKYPVEVSGVDWNVQIGVKKESFFGKLDGKTPGAFVAIRSCKKEHGDKTHLGLLIGYVPIHADVEYDKGTKRMKFNMTGDNPAIFVFDFNEVVLGCESWWGPIESEEHLREITNEDIQNIWYVKALKEFSKKGSE